MTSGTVKFYTGQKGFGFIQPDDGQKDVFVHATALERAGIMNLHEGQKVWVEQSDGSQRAAIFVGEAEDRPGLVGIVVAVKDDVEFAPG